MSAAEAQGGAARAAAAEGTVETRDAPAGITTAAHDVVRAGYQGFGSFHSDNVEDMARDQHWSPPSNPCGPSPEALADLAATPFGAAFRRHFSIDFDSWVFINHGAFGGALRCAQLEAEAWRRRCESQPLLFLDRELFSQLMRVMRQLAQFVGCRTQDLVMLPNATTGLNTVIQSLRGRVGPGDVLFSLDVGYGSVKKMLQEVAGQTGAQRVQLSLKLPLSSPDDLVSQVAEALPPGTRFAVFDAVTSNTAIQLPIQQLVQLCHSRGVEVLVDGAHALGMMPLDLAALGADYFVANCHKWLCAPRGSAFLHVQEQHQPHVRPLIISHGWGSGFVSEFVWDGARDYAPLLGVSAALHAWRQLGPQAVRDYQRQLLQQAVVLLLDAWGTGTLVPLDMCGAMVLVQLPLACLAAARGKPASNSNGLPADEPNMATSADAKWVQDVLHYQHKVEAPIKCIEARLYIRISVHVYNQLEDYEKLADAISSIVQAAGGAAK